MVCFFDPVVATLETASDLDTTIRALRFQKPDDVLPSGPLLTRFIEAEKSIVLVWLFLFWFAASRPRNPRAASATWLMPGSNNEKPQ